MAEGHRHYECRLLQADGRDDLGIGSGPGTEGDRTDLFAPSDTPIFAGTGPAWWDGSASGLQIRRIRAGGGGVEFTVA